MRQLRDDTHLILDGEVRVYGYRTAVDTVNWLERVDVVPLVDGLKPFRAWKLKSSGVYDVATFDDRVVRKGTHVDWPPLIGKIY